MSYFCYKTMTAVKRLTCPQCVYSQHEGRGENSERSRRTSLESCISVNHSGTNSYVSLLFSEYSVNPAVLFFKEISQQVLKNKNSNVILDFSRVEYLDSIFLLKLVTVYKQLKSSGRKLILAHLSEEIEGIIRTAQLGSLLTIVRDVKCAETLLLEISSRYSNIY